MINILYKSAFIYKSVPHKDWQELGRDENFPEACDWLVLIGLFKYNSFASLSSHLTVADVNKYTKYNTVKMVSSVNSDFVTSNLNRHEQLNISMVLLETIATNTNKRGS